MAQQIRVPTQEEINREALAIPPISPPCWRRCGRRIERKDCKSSGTHIHKDDITSKEALEQYLAARFGVGHFYVKVTTAFPEPFSISY
jgi:hypothetical protein